MKLTEKIEELTKELQLSLKLLDKFSDLEFEKDRWNRVFYSSKLANEQVTNADFTHSCGCCSDAALFVMPYLVYEEQKIYSEPYQIIIGRQFSNGGEIPNDDYKSTLKEHNIPDIIIEQVKTYFEENKPHFEENEV
jgi:hypothetical protein